MRADAPTTLLSSCCLLLSVMPVGCLLTFSRFFLHVQAP